MANFGYRTIKGVVCRLTVKDIADLEGTSPQFVRDLHKYGLIKMEKRGKGLTATVQEYEKYLKLTAGADLAGKGDIITFARTHKLGVFS